MGDNKVTIISTIFLLGALLSIGMTSDTAAGGAPTVDGIINVGEYANSVVVDRTFDLGGVYAQGDSGSFIGEPFLEGGHGDWTLYWDSSPTDLFFAAEPIGDFPSHPGESNLGIQLLPITGDPNTGVGVTGCTGTAYFPFFANGGHRAFERCLFGPGIGFESTIFGGSLPPSSTDTVFQMPVGGTITPIEWSMVRGDLDHFGDTAYTGNLQCLWFQISAFDSRSVSNDSGDGVRTIFIKFDPNTPNCGEEIFEKTLVGDITKSDLECATGMPIGALTPTMCTFLLEYTGDPLLIVDTVPAEWVFVSQTGTCDVGPAGKGNPSKSATKIDCGVTGFVSEEFTFETRQSPGKNNVKFKPTSCDKDLKLNEGALALDPTTLEVIKTSNMIGTPTVDDPNDTDCDQVENDKDRCPGSDPINLGPIDGWGCDTEQAGSDD